MKRNILLIIAAILGTMYFIYLFSHFGGALTSSTSDAELVGAGIATALVMPHMVCVFAAVIFNYIAFFCNIRWSALVAGILYAGAILIFFLYGLFVVVQMILCFVAFAKMGNVNKK